METKIESWATKTISTIDIHKKNFNHEFHEQDELYLFDIEMKLKMSLFELRINKKNDSPFLFLILNYLSE
jgi:hypothetical protein